MQTDFPYLYEPSGPAPWVLAGTVQVFAPPRVYTGVETDPPGRQDDHDDVRCVECGNEYALSASPEAACPSCGCPTWISTQIPGPALRGNLRPV